MAAIPDVGEASSELLLAMRKAKLLRHRSDCLWALSPRWKSILLELWHGVTKAEGERESGAGNEPIPFSVAAGIDTWYLNRLDSAGLTPELKMQLEDLQELARHNDEEMETPWRYDGAPLLMYHAGVNTSQGGGVSWSYILRNASLTLLIRKTPLGSIVAQARLGSVCLWRLTPRRALDELDALVRRMWRGSLRHPRKQQGKWQVSQVHLAHDIANTTIALEQLDRYVSRSRRQSVFEAAQADLQSLYAVVDERRTEDDSDLVDPLLDLRWEDAFLPDQEESLDPFLDDEDAASPGRHQAIEPMAAEERAAQVYRWGKRLSGVTWSPGGAISFVEYDKTLEGRLRNKRFMEPIWGARQGGMAQAPSSVMKRGCGVMRCARLGCLRRSTAHWMIPGPSSIISPRSGAISWDGPLPVAIARQAVLQPLLRWTWRGSGGSFLIQIPTVHAGQLTRCGSWSRARHLLMRQLRRVD